MSYWWVNQNQTSKYEISGGFMWSPKRNQNGVYNQFYENMRLTDTGDVVFSYYDQKIKHIGIVSHAAISAMRPEEYGSAGVNWNQEGWFVPVEWHDVPHPFRPRDIFSELQHVLPQKYSPLNPSTGAY